MDQAIVSLIQADPALALAGDRQTSKFDDSTNQYPEFQRPICGFQNLSLTVFPRFLQEG